ncbi:MAG: IS4 family transposase [Candidatus Omnitrophica bacterium CG1_02_49_16]|nr:MAG: IS4 family transposase [Candidatus Omnitrophica bacterium CG1_02_49_16]
MNSGKIVFSQIMEFLPLYEFSKCVKCYNGEYKVRSFSCMDQFLSMAFAQLTYRESLRDIESCLRSMRARLYHMGIRGRISKSTLADANESRDWRIWADFAQVLIHKAKRLYLNDPFGIELKETVYALDSTTIDLCLALFPWAHFRKNKAAVKLHTLLDLRGSIPSFIEITEGKVHDVNILDLLILEPGSFCVMDRGYLDFQRLHAIHLSGAFFVVRAKTNLNFRRLYSRPVKKKTGLRSDQTIALNVYQSAKEYPDHLRLVRFVDKEGRRYSFLTNNLSLEAITIADLYKERWKVELFFKWIKQHLRIKAFFGTSENAVKTQVWIAISIYVLVAIVKKELGLKKSLYEILQILSVTIFEKDQLFQALMENDHQNQNIENDNQLMLFNL